MFSLNSRVSEYKSFMRPLFLSTKGTQAPVNMISFSKREFSTVQDVGPLSTGPRLNSTQDVASLLSMRVSLELYKSHREFPSSSIHYRRCSSLLCAYGTLDETQNIIFRVFGAYIGPPLSSAEASDTL